MAPRPKILYVLGAPRTGSTILSRTLGAVEGFAHCGDLNHIWTSAVPRNTLCTCMRTFAECPFWSDALSRSGYDPALVASQSVRETLHLWGFVRGAPRLLHHTLSRRNRAPMQAFLVHVANLYRTLGDMTGSRVLVDSSKHAIYSWILATIADLDVYALHLVRDPRAVVHSWKRPRLDPGTGVELHEPRTLHGAISWLDPNLGAEVLWRATRKPYMLLRYEDFVRVPEASLEQVFRFIGERPEALPFSAANVVELDPGHLVAGSPSRFDHGRVEIRPDDRWKGQLSRRDKMLVVGLTWPLMLRYRYPLRS